MTYEKRQSNETPSSQRASTTRSTLAVHIVIKSNFVTFKSNCFINTVFIITEWLSAKILVPYQSSEVYSPVPNRNSNSNNRSKKRWRAKNMCASDHLEIE